MPKLITFETDFGLAGITYSELPFRLHNVFLPGSETVKILSEDYEMENGPDGKKHHKTALKISRELMDYFNGKCMACPVWEMMDLGDLTEKEIAVLKAVASIPYGETRSYKEVAFMADLPNAYRFVGSTMAKNPFPVLVPCHRVVKSDGSLGEFGGGKSLKEKMVSLEKTHRRTLIAS